MAVHRLVVTCPDRPGIVAAVAGALAGIGANIVHADQHTDRTGDPVFFMRVEFEGVAPASARQAIAELSEPFAMTARTIDGGSVPELAVFVSKEDHCLRELLHECRNGDLRARIGAVIGNHPDLAEVCAPYGVPFHHVPVSPADRDGAERRQIEICRGVDAVVLAKYMQIVSPGFIAAFGGRVLNIHHSFLPAFVGANPYRQAHERGVKLIGATAHYVTEVLDTGPIVEQDVARVDHRMDPRELRRIGRQVERAVLARAVRWHVEDRVIRNGDRTVVFA